MDLHKGDTSGLPDPGYEFGNFRLQPDGTLLRGDVRVHLTPKQLAALRYLLDHSTQVVSPARLKQALWGSIHVTGDSVPRCVSSLRARLGRDHCIETVYKRGYRMKCGVRPYADSQSAALPRLAIVPFSCGYEVQPHMGTAISEEAAAVLTSFEPAITSVLARDSVFALAAKGETALEIGRNLRADLVLSGTLQAWSSFYRLRVEMIRVKDGTQIWIEDMLVARHRADELARQLIQRIVGRLGGPIDAIVAMSPYKRLAVEGDPRAYDLYLRGHSEWQSLERPRMESATEMLMQAAQMNPELIAARVDIVHAFITQAFYGFLPARLAVEQMRRAAQTIPDVDRNAPTVLPALGWAAFHIDRDLQTALRLADRAKHLPYDSWTTRIRVMLALSRHRFDEALDVLHSALRVDPMAPWLHARIAWTLHLAHRTWEAKEKAEYCLVHFPRHESTNFYSAQILAFAGEPERAVALAHELFERSPHSDTPLALEAYAHARAGNRAATLAILERVEWLNRERFMIRSLLAPAYLALGDAQSAIDCLLFGESNACPWFFQMLADPRLQDLNGHPEFARMRSDLAQMESRVASPHSA